MSQVSWNDAVAFCKWLSQQEQATYRLPTESEWEFACRAGTTTVFSFGDDLTQHSKYGWYHAIAGSGPRPVGTKLPNPFGLFDMHGNLAELCSDFFRLTTYAERSYPATDPKGPESGSAYAQRGGCWLQVPYQNYSTNRYGSGPISRYCGTGFRVARDLNSTAPPPTSSANPAANDQSTQLNNPAFQQWLKDVAKLPAHKQVEEVAKKLVELNPGYTGQPTGTIENGVVIGLVFESDLVSDISPVRALVGLKRLDCGGSGKIKSVSSKLSDLRPLQGMALTELSCGHSRITDLEPLKGMKLAKLTFHSNPLTDLTPLQGMPITSLSLNNCWKLADLTPLKGMPIVNLSCNGLLTTDLSPLQGMPLEGLTLAGTPVADLSPIYGCKNLQGIELTRTRVSPEGLAAFRAALPNCRVRLD